MLIADGLDDGVLGIGRRFGQDDLVVYSIEKCANLLVKQGLSYEEAIEYLEFNSIGAWVGDETPIWVHEMTMDEVKAYAEEL